MIHTVQEIKQLFGASLALEEKVTILESLVAFGQFRAGIWKGFGEGGTEGGRGGEGTI